MVRPRSSSLAKNGESHSEAPGDWLRRVHQKHRETGCEGFTQKKVKQ